MDDTAALTMLTADEVAIREFRDDEWRSLIKFLLDSLQAFFGGRVVTEPIENASVGEGFCLHVSSEKGALGVPMNWKGILGATIIDGRLYVSLTVFFYSGDKRLFASDGNEFAEYELDVNPSDGCSWRLLDWLKDIYGEFDGYL